jgi:hypothetical protein
LYVIPVMKCGCVLGIRRKEVGNTTRTDKIKIKKTKSYGYATCLPLALSVSREERSEVLACFHVVVKMYRCSLEERVFIVKAYWITGSINNCQRRFVEQFGGRNPSSKPCIQLLVKKLILSCYQLPFCEFPKHTTALHYRYDLQMYCTLVLFVNKYFPRLPESGTHCIYVPRSQPYTIARTLHV